MTCQCKLCRNLEEWNLFLYGYEYPSIWHTTRGRIAQGEKNLCVYCEEFHGDFPMNPLGITWEEFESNPFYSSEQLKQ